MLSRALLHGHVVWVGVCGYLLPYLVLPLDRRAIRYFTYSDLGLSIHDTWVVPVDRV